VRWRLAGRAHLLWPHARGDQPLYEVDVAVHAGPMVDSTEVSDHRRVRTGLRQVRIRDFVATINGERLFLKGANCGPTRRALADATSGELAGDVTLVRGVERGWYDRCGRSTSCRRGRREAPGWVRCWGSTGAGWSGNVAWPR